LGKVRLVKLQGQTLRTSILKVVRVDDL